MKEFLKSWGLASGLLICIFGWGVTFGILQSKINDIADLEADIKSLRAEKNAENKEMMNYVLQNKESVAKITFWLSLDSGIDFDSE